MIFAAGMGTRLQPLTRERPKALVELQGIPLLEIAIRRLKFFGIREIVINVHHFADQILTFLEDNKNFGISIVISDEREQLLNTGGGLKKAAPFLQEAPFLLLNVDVLSDLDLLALFDSHCRSGALATLAVRQRPSSRYLLFDEEMILTGWGNHKTGDIKASRPIAGSRPWSFSGIQVVDPALFQFMPPETVFSTIDLYLQVAQHHIIRGYPHDEGLWIDVGKTDALAPAAGMLDNIPLASRD